MKKYVILFLVFVGFVSTSQAQFESGESFVSGSFYTDLQKNKRNTPDINRTSFTSLLSISVGKFVKENKAVGWTFSNNLSLFKLNQPEYIKPLQSLGFGVGRFVEYYKPLAGKFAVYARPGIGIGYSLSKEYSGTGDLLIYEATNNRISLNTSLEAGLAWRFATKWALYGSVAFSNPVSVSTSFNRRKYTDGLLDQRGNSFDYNFNPTASSGQIGLGLRYFCGKK